MNRRQKKKAYKKKYGYNPPKTEVKYHRKKWGKLMNGMAEAIRAAIPVVRKIIENMARLAQEITTRIQTMPEEEFNSLLENSDIDESTKALARQIRRKEQNGLRTGNARENREGGEAGNTTPGTTDNTGLHGSRADNTAGNKYGS